MFEMALQRCLAEQVAAEELRQTA